MSDNLPVVVEKPQLAVGQYPPGRELHEDELKEAAEVRLDSARRWLHAYAACWSSNQASRACGIHNQNVRYWDKTDPVFYKMRLALKAEAEENWTEHAQNKAKYGFRKQLFDADGELKATELREDPSFLAKVMASMNPDWRPNDQGAEIVINIIRRDE